MQAPPKPVAYLPIRNAEEFAVFETIVKEFTETRHVPLSAKFQASAFWNRVANVDQTAAYIESLERKVADLTAQVEEYEQANPPENDE